MPTSVAIVNRLVISVTKYFPVLDPPLDAIFQSRGKIHPFGLKKEAHTS